MKEKTFTEKEARGHMKQFTDQGFRLISFYKNKENKWVGWFRRETQRFSLMIQAK